jgi:putative chitinase
MISKHELRLIMPLAGDRIETFFDPLNDTLVLWDITTQLRIAAFLATVAHESAEFRYMRELASGEAYDTGPLAKRLGNTPEEDGDGQKYRGRGPIQITGFDNYQRCSIALYDDERLLDRPELLEQPFDGCMAAGWFWSTNRLNQLADQQDFRGITKVVNGGYTHFDKRLVYYKRGLEVLGVLV